MTAPGGRFRGFLLRHCSAAIMERLVDPVLADIHVEASAAAVRGHRWTSRRIRAAGAVALTKALVVYGWTRFWRFHEWPAKDRRVAVRTLVYSAIVASVATPLLILPRLSAARAPEHALYLVLEAMTNAVPIGLLIGLLYGFEAKVVSLRPRIAFIVVAILCSIGSLAAVAWAPELTFGELRSRIAFNRRLGLAVPAVEVVYYGRWALAFAPIVLTAWALLVAARLPSRRTIVGIVAIASSVAYFTLVWTGYFAVLRRGLPPMAGAWLANAVFVAALMLLTRRTSNPRTPNPNPEPNLNTN
jgi:hypothetical protein